MQALLVLAHFLPVPVDHHYAGVGQDRVGMARQLLEARSVKPRFRAVVGGGPAEELRLGHLAQVAVIRGRAEVPRVPDVAHAGVARRVRPSDLGGPVGRRVVPDQHDKILDGLIQERIERRGEVTFAVVDRNAHRDPGRHERIPSFRA